jgi:integrase
MSVRKFGDGWQADFYAYGDRIRKVFPIKGDAVAYEGKMKGAIRENRYFDVKPEAFQVFKELSNWYLSLEEVKRKKSFIRDKRSVSKLNDFFATKPLKQMTPSLVGEYQSKRLSEKSYRAEATKPATVNREISCLKTMFSKAIQNNKLERNPIKGVKLLKENNERERVLSAEEWEAYKANCPSWYLPIAVTAYRTAMRKSEIINLSPSRVDLEEAFIRLRPEDTKTGYGRSIPIHPELMEILKDALKVAPSNSGKVFHRDGEPINCGDIRRAHNSVCKKAKIENFIFHDFRHTCINNWRKEGHDYFRIMAASGHRTISVFKRYNLVDEGELKTLVNGRDSDKENRNPEPLPQCPSPNSGSIPFLTIQDS